jgi:hypothetical protein
VPQRGPAVPSERPLGEPSPARLALDAPRRDETLARHDDAMRRGEPGYTDPVTELFVFTARYLAERGACCASNCRHCPYTTSDVP